MGKSSWDYFIEQKRQLEQQQFRNDIMNEIEFTLKSFKDELRAEMDQKIKQEVYQQYQSQKVDIKFDASEAAKEIQRALRF